MANFYAKMDTMVKGRGQALGGKGMVMDNGNVGCCYVLLQMYLYNTVTLRCDKTVGIS